jgi:hypothetical protein
VGIVLAFDAYLRECEMLRLTVADVVLPDDARVGAAFAGRCGLRLGKTKTGDNKFVEVLRPEVICLLQMLVRTVRTSDSRPLAPLFTVAPATLLRHFKEAAGAFGLDPRTVIHSCRHGGATSDFLRDRDITWITHRGRWASVKSAQHYIQAGRALLIASTSKIPRATLDMADVAAADVLASFALAQEHRVGVG